MNQPGINPLLAPDAVKMLSELATFSTISPGFRSLVTRTLNRQHPNKEPFHGVLCPLDVPSNFTPSGSNGHRVILTRSAAKDAIKSLIGMGIDCEERFSRHHVHRKVGVITHARITHNQLEVSGHLFVKDFPDVVAEIAVSRKGEFGMSSEIDSAKLEGVTADVWVVNSCMFTGAAVVRNPAYRETWIELGE